MKNDFFTAIDLLLLANKDVFLLMAGLGYPRTQELINKYPKQAFNTEASEQTALDMAVGLAYAKKIPFVYTITPFLLRGFETIRTYINHENLPVFLVGAGRDDDYSKHDGFSHDAKDIQSILALLPNIKQYYPTDKKYIPKILSEMVQSKSPAFLSLVR